jgi:hypothetical protein
MFIIGMLVGAVILVIGIIIGLQAEKILLFMKPQRKTPRFEGKNGLLSYRNITRMYDMKNDYDEDEDDN